MDLTTLKRDVYEANLELVKRGLVLFTWGNASGVDRDRGLVVIKPSGVSYDAMKPEDMVVLDLETGAKIEGDLKPSTDAPTHLVFYRSFPNVGGVVHTHSSYATAWAQAGRDIPVVGTTCADYFYRPIPCARSLTREEIERDYEKATGEAIVESFRLRNVDPDATPGALARNHGPFTWGATPAAAVYHAVVLEEIAKTTFMTALLNPELPVDDALVEKHYARKHGPNAYYGQADKKSD